ncbi:MAG TPA: UvrD-helicase domain-containing protein, partial [Halococcus sp.]|nr:UvrD-helicase domain-containing protein [Halococcus sp.]
MSDHNTPQIAGSDRDEPKELDEQTGSTDRPDPLVASDFSLTDQQADAMALGRHLSVTAAAGTGKTTALAARYLHILQQTEATPREIATITFTRKATTEMRERIRENVSAQLGIVEDDEFDHWRSVADELSKGYIHTVDAFCARLLREYAVEAGVDPEFDMLDEVAAPVLQREAITNYLDQNPENQALSLVARLWKRDTVVELLRGLLTVRPESTAWARDRLDRTTETHITELYEVFAEVNPAGARAILGGPAMQAALSTLRSLDLEEIGVPRDDYAWENIELYLRPAAESAGATDPDGADDVDVLRALRRLADGITTTSGTPYNSARGRGSHHIAGKKGNWPDEEQEAYRDALEVLLETLTPEFDAIRTIPSQIDENAASYTGALAEVYLDCLQTYEDLKSERTAFDFDDLLTKAHTLIKSDSEILETLQERFDHIMVDEFQDTDPRQWQLVSLLSGIADSDCEVGEEATVFVVGDKKQSIYRFRGADVATFSDARAALVTANTTRDGITAINGDTEPPTELELTGSFRTLTEPIETLNPLFEHVFQPAGETHRQYEAEPQSIDPARDEGTGIDGTVEYLVVPETEAAAEALYDDDHPLRSRTYLGKGDREARALAARISTHLNDGTEIFDNENNESRCVEPRDVAVLLRTRKNLAAYERAFDEYDIPVNVISGDGYWESPEIRMLCNLVEVLFDPTQDIPLYGLLRSPMFGLTDTEIAPYAVDERLWAAMADADNGAIADAYSRLRDWREAYGIDEDPGTFAGDGEGDDRRTGTGHTPSYRTVNKLLTIVFEDTGILASIGAGERGQQAVANIQKFQEQIRQWSDQGVRTLAAIRDRITNQQAESAKERDAALPSETGGVRILTVHASKGLEFPIVAVPEIGRGFNFDGSLDERKQAYLRTYPPESRSDRYLGIAGPGVADTYETVNTAVKDTLHSREKEELRAEEKRTLYVACTRV